MMREFVKTLLVAVACIAAFIWLLGMLTSCRHPLPGPGEPQASAPKIHCGTEAVEACAPSLLSGINDCINSNDDVTACIMMSVVKPVGCAVFEVVACLVRGEGSKAEHLAQAERSSGVGIMGPAGSVNWRRAERAKEFLERSGAKFEEGGGP
jgi:hypothetical protein